jgi:outer membrane receptor for ferrienterochelin and colicin
MKRTVLVCMAILVAVPVLAADQQPAKETKLDEMVVTATRTEKSIADAPGSVSVVTTEEI